VAQDRNRYEEALNKGHSYIWDQQWPEAIQAFETAAKEFPQEPAPYAGLGMVYAELGQFRKALDSYKTAARHSQGDIIHLKPIAELQEQLGMLPQAGQTHQAIGEIQLRLQKIDEAVTHWLRATRLDSHALLAHQRLAAVYQRQGQIPNAVHEYLAAARILQEQGQHDKAMEACQTALRLDPRHSEALTAVEFLQHGQTLPAPAELAAPLPASAPPSSLVDSSWSDGEAKEGSSSPVQDAQRMAMEQLAEVIFDDSDDDEETDFRGGLNKLERDALITQALDYQTRGMTNEAISAYERAIAGGITGAAAHFNLGLLLQEKMRFEDAIGEFEISVRDQHYRLASHFALGESYRGRGRIEKAIEHFITALKIVDLGTVQHDQADRLIELYENLADSLLTKGESEQAIGFTNSLVEFLSHKGWEDKVKEARVRLDTLSGGRTMILGDILTAGSQYVLESLYLGQEYARRGFYSSAIEETYRAIQLSPDYLPAHLQLGDLLSQQDRREAAVMKFLAIGDTYRARSDVNGAIFAYERAAEIAPLDLTLKGRLIDLLKRHGDIDRSLKHYIAMGEAYYQLAQVDKARESYQEALQLAPRGTPEKKWRVQLLRLIADIDVQRFDWRRALSAYQELHKEDPTNERVAITLVDLYYKVGQPESGLRELDRYLIYLVKSGRGAKVEGILNDMIQQRPTDPGPVDRLIRLYTQRKQVDKAIKLLDQLGEAQLNAGEMAKAVQTIERLLTLNPPNLTDYQQLLAELKRQ
jgi:tetratricopeptide (TPR) repeat protein